MSRGLRNNNPGNIRHDKDKWQGEVFPSRDKAFKQFESMAWGYRAMFHLLNNYSRLHGLNTIRQIIGRYAPPEDNNNTAAYVSTVSRLSGVGADIKVTTTNRDVMIPIVAAMSKVENGVSAMISDVEQGWTLFIQHKR